MPASVCVIDNASTDDTAETLARHPHVRVLNLDRNHGFGAAVNRGAASSEADAIVLVNNDAVLDEHFLERMAAAMERTDADAVAGCMRSIDGTLESLGVTIDRCLSVYDTGYGLAEGNEYTGPSPVGPSGGAALFRRAAFLACGGFDEAIFAYLEDADLAIRMRVAGMTFAEAPDAVLCHEHSATLGAGSARKNELMGYARRHLLWKHGRGLPRIRRAQAHVTDLIVFSGKALIDRNLGAFRGYLRARREQRGLPRPDGPGMEAVPFATYGPIEALARRLDRRR